MAIDGQAPVVPLIVVFVAALAVSVALAGVALWPGMEIRAAALQARLPKTRTTF